jgi:spore coat protein U-like protein
MFNRFNLSKSLLAVSVVSGAFFTAPAFSQTATGTLNVSTTVQAACTFGTLATPGNTFSFIFPDFQVGGPSIAPTTPASIDVECASAATTAVLSTGAVGAAPGSRTMTSGLNSLKYDLYTSAARTTVFGGTNTITIAGGAPAQAQLFGTIPTAQNLGVAPGAYADIITLTLTF